MHPYAEGSIASARKQIAKCVALLRAAVTARREEEWELIGEALARALTAQAQLEDAMTLDELAVTVGEDATG